MILSTTPTIEGHPIREYRGVVTGETIIGTNFVKDFFASVRDVIGGRSGSYESTLREAKDTALREMACLLYTSPSPRDISGSRMPSSA